MKSIGLARLGRDAEVRFTPAGDAVCNLSLAVNYGMKPAEGNRPTQWYDATLWGKQAEALAQYLVKGSVHCFALSDIRIEAFTRADGSAGTKLAARVDSVELGPRQGGAEQGGEPQAGQPAAQRQLAPRPSPKPAPDYDDQDIPF